MRTLLATRAGVALCLLATWPAAASDSAPGGRKTVSLDGVWQLVQGGMDSPPTAFDHTVPVPGLADMATPAFTDVGIPSDQRRAFWYRRMFTVGGPARRVAILKVTKAQFGTKVWLNGHEAGEHPGCFTPGYFDLTKLIRYGSPNALVIRVGADRNALPPTIPTNTDYEQTRWIPGIYDSVSLILAGNPYVESVQVAPRIRSNSALVQVTLRNISGPAVVGPVRLAIQETRTGKAAGEATSGRLGLASGERKTFTLTIPLRHPHLWSPEDPFLYSLRCETGVDTLETRFGMREFHYDRATGRAMLNGRPYYLRGANFCLFRFFEDPLRGGLPWNRAWVRKLLSMPRSALHWNHARVCIASMPEFWYELADELGWLLQDEFPIWGFHDQWSQSEIVAEFKEWIQERWNHPSLAVWDACNETLTPRTGQAIRVVRDLDLSRRPWDDGYSAPNRPGDAVEDHPYRFTEPAFDLEELGTALDRSQGLRKPPVVINEYAWLWLNRDGTPTTLTKGVFDAKLGANATAAKRREFAAYNTAALTEYWRARREAAAVDHFCYLTYSRPGGQTSDNFVDLRRLTLEPRFLDFMRNAFSPLAVMVDDFESRLTPGARKTYRIIVTNDLYEPRRGTLALRVTRPGKAVSILKYRAPFDVPGLGQRVLTVPLDLPREPGDYRLTAELIPDHGQHVLSRRNVRVVTPKEARRLVNIAAGCAATASSEVHDARGYFPAGSATDGKGSTRWSSEFSDPQWIRIDLGRERMIRRAVLRWEAAYGKAYRIKVSGDGATWTDVYSTENGHGSREEITFAPVSARYVRLVGTSRGTAFGYSLWEFGLFED